MCVVCAYVLYECEYKCAFYVGLSVRRYVRHVRSMGVNTGAKVECAF